MRIGVLFSGGDAPGMNPCLRAIVRAAGAYNNEIIGIAHGYSGLLKEEFLTAEDVPHEIRIREVSGLTSKGGTILHSSRCKEFQTPEGVQKAADILHKHQFGGLITVGGNGTLTGAKTLGGHWNGRIIGLPGTIDNDLLGTDYTIGFATAVATAVEAIDKLRDTAGSHDLMFVVEVMGRHCGDLAMHGAIAGGCEVVAVPEIETSIEDIVAKLRRFKQMGKQSMIMIVAEGGAFGGAEQVMTALKQAGSPFEMRGVVLGHVQRGGSPVPADRILATVLGCAAVKAINDGETGKMVGLIGSEVVLTPFEDVIVDHRQVTPQMMKLLEIVSG